MFPRFPYCLAAFLLAGSAVARSAVGQIDHRVNQANTGGAGHALDANPGRGSGGFNRPGGQFDAGGYSGAIISGNITGLGGFKAYSPVLQNNQFRAALPSAGLSAFEGVSVGVGDVLSNRGLTPTRYYGVERTISDVGFIREGMNLPGSSRLASPYVTPPTGVFSDRLTAPPSGGVAEQGPAGYREFGTTGIVRQEVIDAGSAAQYQALSVDQGFQRAGTSSIFGVPPSPFARRTGREDARSALDQSRGIGPRGLPELEEPELPTDSAGAVMAVTPGAPPVERRVEATLPTGVVQVSSEVGGDLYSDFLGAVRTAAAHGLNKMVLDVGGGAEAVPSDAVTTPSAEDTADAAANPPASVHRRPVLGGVAELAAAARWAGDLLEHPVSTFAGRHRDRLNQYMAAGEEALREGEYYRAADLFELAQTVDPENPLPWLHRGHALLAAGQYMSAAWSVQQGIARFPQIAAFRLDLPSFGGQQAIFDTRRADLEKRLMIVEHYEMRFLLGYLELYSGLPEDGLRNLDLAAKQAPPESIVAVFADLVSGRRELPNPGAETRQGAPQ